MTARRPLLRWVPCWMALALAPALAGCEDTASLEIVQLTVGDNPRNVLSCYVRWHTPVPARSRVEFGEGDELAFVVGDDEWRVEHEVFVFGMHPRSTYTLQAVSEAEDGREVRSERWTYHTPELPFTSATFEVTHHDPQRVQPGWTLANLAVSDFLNPTVAAMIDLDGQVVWYHQLEPIPTFSAIEVTMLAGQRVLIGGGIAPGLRPVEVDLEGIVLWEGRAQADDYLADGWMNHTFQRLPSGNDLTLTWKAAGANLLDTIEEMDPDGKTVWSWDAVDHIPDASEEHIHGNMALIDDAAGVAYFHAYMTNSLYQIDRASGDILWILGQDGDFELLGEHEWPWFQHAHAPEFLEDGTLLLYDNGGEDDRTFSRVVQYALDETACTAEIVWEYPGELAEDEWYTYAWGDADRLANGNTLVTAGSLLTFDSQSRIFEVAADGTKVWQVLITSETEADLGGCYMSERIPVPIDSL